MQHANKHNCNIRQEKTDETLGTEACNIYAQLLQHMQHSDLLLQHTTKTSETLETYACNMCFQHNIIKD
jgi:hypothetical protein